MGYKIQDVKKTRMFGGKRYTWFRYTATKRDAEEIADTIRHRRSSARITPQPGYGQGGWNIYIRGRV